MRISLLAIATFALVICALPVCVAYARDNQAQDKPMSAPTKITELRVIDYNLWHGLNPTSLTRFGEFETAEVREKRLQGFLQYARRIDPHVIFLQEVNPVHSLSQRIADELGMTRVYQVGNSGLKIGSVGLPTNLFSGLAILAKPELGLKDLGGRKISGGFGITSRWFSFQTHEFRYSHAARITVNGRPVLLLNTHLHHGPEVTREVREVLDRLVSENKITHQRREEVVATINHASARRMGELKATLTLATDANLDSAPTLFAGDFNASPDAPELMWLKTVQHFHSSTDEVEDDESTWMYTWDYQRNPNTHTIDEFVPVNTFEPVIQEPIHATQIGESRRLDYIFVRNAEGFLTRAESGLFANEPYEGVLPSDHFGLFAVFAVGE